MAATPRDRFTSRSQAAARFVAQRGLLKAVVWSVTNVTVIGRERLKGVDGSYVVVANHSSHLDAPLIQGSMPRKLARYLAAGAAADYFFDVWWRRRLTALFFNAFPVDRTGSAKRSVSAKELLARGVPLLVFPEGTRSKDGTVAPFKPGAAALAASADVPIIPVALVGAHQAHPRGSKWPKAGRQPVAVVFGDPMTIQPGETAQAFAARIRSTIVALLDEHSERVLGRPAATPEGDPQ